MSALVDEAAVLLDAQGKVVEANQRMLDIFGAQIIGLPMERFLRHPDFTRALQEALSGDTIAELDYSRMDQVRREFKLRVAPFEPGFAMLVLEDITEGSSVDRIRTDFVANVSHELRSPLTALSGFIETLIDGAAEDPQARDNFLGIMQSEAGRMQRLIDDLLSLSRVQAEAHRLPSGLVDMRLLLPQITSLLAGQADKRDMRLAVVFDADLGTDALSVVGHADELQQVFVNLIENAIRYGDAGSDVRLVVGKGRRTPAQAPVDNLLRVQAFNQGLGDPGRAYRPADRTVLQEGLRQRPVAADGRHRARPGHRQTHHQPAPRPAARHQQFRKTPVLPSLCRATGTTEPYSGGCHKTVTLLSHYGQQ